MEFEQDLRELLPDDLPHRDVVVEKAALHLRLIVEANAYMNLTRITTPREAAIKHVLDSVLPWRLFAEAGSVLDAGTGAGFPGIPLAIVLPGVRFTLAESTGKKARFVETAVEALSLTNVIVSNQRVEENYKTNSFGIVTARAFAPLSKALDMLAPVLREGAAGLLYKGPDPEQEIADAARELKKYKTNCRVAWRYDLPEELGKRTILAISA